MIPIPVAIQPWMIRGGAIALLLSAVFYGGCHTQKKMDEAKIQRVKANYTRAVEIIETFQENYDKLDKVIKDNNERIARQGKEYEAKVADIQKAHGKAIDRLTRSNREALRTAEEEASDLRERMAGLSTGEACHEAMLEIVRQK